MTRSTDRLAWMAARKELKRPAGAIVCYQFPKSLLDDSPFDFIDRNPKVMLVMKLRQCKESITPAAGKSIMSALDRAQGPKLTALIRSHKLRDKAPRLHH